MSKTLNTIISIEEELFDGDDSYCIKACGHVCQLMEVHLEKKGFKIDEWCKGGGCEEDWGVLLDTQFHDQKIRFLFGFYAEENVTNCICVKAYTFLPFLKSLFKEPPALSQDAKEIIQSFSDKTVKVFEEDE